MVEIEVTDEFTGWYEELTDAEAERVNFVVDLLEEQGVRLGDPYSTSIQGSKVSRLRELRTQHAGTPIRVLYAFDPVRIAVLLIGGFKTEDRSFYRKMIPLAERLYREHLAETGREQ